MYQRLKTVLKTATVRQSAITTVSTFLVAGLGAIFYLVLARIVGPAEYGLLSLSLQVVGALTPLADIGTGTVLVRFVGEHAKSEKYLPYANLALKTKIVTGLVCVLILTIFANNIGTHLIQQPKIIELLPLAGLGVLAMILYSFTTSTLQGLQKFIPWGVIQIVGNIIRLIVVALLFFSGSLTGKTALFSFIFSIGIVFVLGWFWLNKKIISSQPTRQVWKEFWHYGRWTAAFTIVAAIVSRMDGFFTARYLKLEDIGIYALALTMSSFLPQLTSALGAVTSPKFANFETSTQVHTYLRKSLLFSTCISLAVSLLMIPTALVVIQFTGKSYTGSLIPFILVLIGMCIFGATAPLRDTILFAYKRPDLFVYIGLLQGVVITICSVILIPKIGINGAALSSLISQAFLSICVVFVYKKTSH